MKNWIMLLLFGAVVIAACFFTYRERSTYQCAACLSKQHVYQWRVGLWSSSDLPLSRQRMVTEASFASKTLMQSNHLHSWRFAQGSPYYFFGTKWGGCALGTGRYQGEFAFWFEREADFRKFVFQQIALGKFTTNDAIQFVQLPAGTHIDNTNQSAKLMVVQTEELINQFLGKL